MFRSLPLVRVASVALALTFLLPALAPTTARAGIDVCPEPNGTLATACFLGPGGPAAGYLDTAEDVDGYKLDLPRDSMIVATLGGLPGDYTLRLHMGDGSIKSQANEVGLADKVIRADGLPPGTYYLSVVSLRGDFNPDQPYLISVNYPASLVLNPTAPAPPPGGPQGAIAYIPPPAASYALKPSDVGPGFREVVHEEPEGGRSFRTRILAPDARVVGDTIYLSNTRVSLVDSLVFVEPYGSNDEVAAIVNDLLGRLANRGFKVEPTQGWGSEQVYSYAATDRGVWFRGIVLKHRNAVAFVEILGVEGVTTWDNVSSLMRIVEKRIWAAAQ